MNVTFLSSSYTHAMHTPVNMHMCDAYICMNVHAKTHNKQALKYAVLCVLIQGTLPFVPVNASGMLPPPLPPVCTTCIMKLLVGHCGRGMEWLHGWLPFGGTHQRRV